MSGWVKMTAADLAAVQALAEHVHPSLPEDDAVLAQRLRVFPEGCLVLRVGSKVEGYAFSHPIPANQPPALNTAPETIAEVAKTFYIHDFVVAPSQRGTGQAAKGVEILLGLGKAYDDAALISVYGTTGFWQKFGFRPAAGLPAEKLESYGQGSVFMERR